MFGLEKTTAQLIGIAVILTIIVGGYFWWKRSIYQEALASWNSKQLEIVRQEQAELMKDLSEVAQNQQALLKELRAQNEAIDKKFADLDDYLNSPATVKKYQGKQSSDALKRAFKALGSN